MSTLLRSIMTIRRNKNAVANAEEPFGNLVTPLLTLQFKKSQADSFDWQVQQREPIPKCGLQ
jgi:hypothetical protein